MRNNRLSPYSTITLRTIEEAYGREIELAASGHILYTATNDSEADLPASFSFSIPLTEDAPQCIHTPHSSLSHTLTACLQRSDPDAQPLTKSLTVHTRRYTSHAHALQVAPETHSLDNPTRVEVEVSRSTFKAGEPIPIYVTVPPPQKELVVDQGLRLRNVRAELVRMVKVKGAEEDTEESVVPSSTAIGIEPFLQEGPSSAAVSTAVEKASLEPETIVEGSSYKTIVARSGASCRFHSSLPVRLRFVLRQPPPSSSPPNQSSTLPDGEYSHLDSGAHCSSITQDTLLHSVLFRVNVHVSFVDTTNRTERFSTISFPVVMIPPPAPLPEVEESVDAAYQKKHDKPPSKTVRADDWDASAPHYQEGEAGPSALQHGEPPPFEERDAPPPFFPNAPEASSSARGAPPPFFPLVTASTTNALPTFLESQSAFSAPSDAEQSISSASSAQPIIPGESIWFGFSPTEQFNGHLEEMERSSTPPPTLEMANLDTNVTRFADLTEPRRAIEAMGIAMQQEEDDGGTADDIPPPPPPAMDDPSDPPPSIDSDFRSPNQRVSPSRHTSPSPPHASFNETEQDVAALPDSLPAAPARQADGHAPPPYPVPGNEEHVMRPPPYVDLLPPNSD